MSISNYNSPFIERVFVMNQGATQASILTGAAVTDAALIRIPPNGVKLTPAMPITPVPWKTGTRSMHLRTPIGDLGAVEHAGDSFRNRRYGS